MTGKTAVVIAVLSITDADEGATYASIARALAADYYNLYYVNLDTEHFIEYSSRAGLEDISMERHGSHFFKMMEEDSERIFPDDRDYFRTSFTKENIIRELEEQGVYTLTYRLMDSGSPVYVYMKVMQMHSDKNHIIIGLSTIDSQMKQKEMADRLQKEQDAYDRILALSEDYLGLYTVNSETGSYIEYSATDEFESLGFARSGDDFFSQAIIDGKKAVHPEDLPGYLEQFSKENILESIRQNGVYSIHYRLMIGGEARPVSLKIAPVKENETTKLIAGVRAWRVRK